MKIQIIGTGIIGSERIGSIKKLSEINTSIEISSVYDINYDTLLKVRDKYNVPIVNTIEDGLDKNPDWVIISTSNDVVKEISSKAFLKNANVLIEKPFGRSLSECYEILKLKPENKKLMIGFNYRFFSGIESALQDVKNNVFGKIISVNLILGHGNSPGMEKSWRFDPKNHGDCVTDLGVHLLDLILQISNSDINIDYAKCWRGFWNTGIIEECHFMVSNCDGTIFNAQVSFNRWKSYFKLEINGTEGYGIVENRGRSYGPQSYRIGKRWGWLNGKSQTETEEYIVNNYDCKDSFTKEMANIFGITDILTKSSACSHIEGKEIMIALDKLYKKLEY